jgi:hypothetical protein
LTAQQAVERGTLTQDEADGLQPQAEKVAAAACPSVEPAPPLAKAGGQPASSQAQGAKAQALAMFDSTTF